jgi:hypothetical protein
MAVNAAQESINLVYSGDHAGMLPADVAGQGSARGPRPRAAGGGDEDNPPAQLAQTAIKKGKDTIIVNMEIKFPKKEKKVKEAKKKVGSILSGLFSDQKFPEPLYFQNVDCVAIPFLFSKKESQHIIDFAEASEFRNQHRYRGMNFAWVDIVDPYFCEAIWTKCGLSWFLRSIVVDGMVPVGLNDVIRIHKYGQGSLFGRHIDQNVKRADGKVSRYSLRVFLNGSDGEFEGGSSIFHIPFRADPVVFEPETGLAMLYPQGDQCTVQEEAEVHFGAKYVLRADILFGHPTS